MDSIKDAYRQRMIDQLQHWDDEIVRLSCGAEALEAEDRIWYKVRLRELARRQYEALGLCNSLLLANEDQWDEMQAALDATAERVQEQLDRLTLQAA